MTGVDVAIVDHELVHPGGLDLIVRLAKAAGESQGAKSAQMGFWDQFTKILWRPFQLSKKNKSKNCFEILMAKEMGLDRAPWNFNFLFFPCICDTP